MVLVSLYPIHWQQVCEPPQHLRKTYTMKTLANFENYNEFLYAQIEFMREVYESNLIQTLEAIRDNKVILITHQSNGKEYAVPKCSVDVSFNGKRWKYSRVIQDVHRVYSMARKSPAPVPDLDTFVERFDWLKQSAQGFLDLANTWQGRAALFQFAQVPEKGIDKEYRQRFGFGKVNGFYMPGKVHEILQAEEFERCGGKAAISSADKMTVNGAGDIAVYDKKNRATSGKKLDQLYEGTYIKFYTTNKAHTAELDGGGRTTEYEADAGKTVHKRTLRFAQHGYEFQNKKLVLLGALIDSRFFAGKQGPNAIRLMQNMANNKDTFVLNAITLAKFMTLIDVPEVVVDTDKVITEAFDKLSVEV